MSNPKTIGILAGMGPYSTGPFVNMVVDECHRQYAPRHEEEFPHMLIYSLPTPFRIDEESTNHSAVREAICGGLRRLEAAGVDFIAMPCNTAHIYYDALAACIDKPLLNMIDIAVNAALPLSGKVTVIGTVFTVNAGLYQDRLAAAGADLVQRWQTETDELIFAIHAKAPDRFARWEALTGQIAAAGVETAILACTDLNVVSESAAAPFTLIDATRTLAAATIQTWLTAES